MLDKIVYEALAPAASALHQLPPPPSDFTGREVEIAELLAALEDASLTISGLQGMGRVGSYLDLTVRLIATATSVGGWRSRSVTDCDQ